MSNYGNIFTSGIKSVFAGIASLWKMLSRLLIAQTHSNIGHVGTVSVAVLFTNTILEFQRLLGNSQDRVCFVCLWAEGSAQSESRSACLALMGSWTKDQGVSVRIYGVPFSYQSLKRLCLNTGLIFFPPAANGTSHAKPFWWFEEAYVLVTIVIYITVNEVNMPAVQSQMSFFF